MPANDEAIFDRLGEFVAALMATKGVPGVVVGVLHRGEMATAGFGVTNVDHPSPVTEQTLFQVGSITKTFTGTAIMRLVEMGKLNLDAKVRTYLPDFRVADETASSQVTVRHLLTHTAGWVGDFFNDTGAGDDALPRYVADMADLEQLAPLGSVWSYNNAGFSVAGHVIETVTGKSYQAVLKELVLDPLGLAHVYFDPGDVMTHRFAVGHNAKEGGPEVARPWALPRSVYPAGGVICTAQDLLRYAQFHMGDGKAKDKARLLKAESLADMHSPHVTVWGDAAWGLTWALDKIDGTRQLSHGGGTTGQISLLALIPAHDFAIAILTNANRGGILTREISRWALREYLGLETPQPTPIEAAEEELIPYVGPYHRPFADIELGMLGGKLVGQVTPKQGFPTQDSPPAPAPPPMALVPCDKDRLLVLDGPYKDAVADVIRRADGSIGWLRFSGRIHRHKALVQK